MGGWGSVKMLKVTACAVVQRAQVSASMRVAVEARIMGVLLLGQNGTDCFGETCGGAAMAAGGREDKKTGRATKPRALSRLSDVVSTVCYTTESGKCKG